MEQVITKLVIPGLTRSYTFFQTSDTHLSAALETEPPEAHQGVKEMNDNYTEIEGFPPTTALEEALRIADEAGADGIFLCGDTAEGYSEGSVKFICDRVKQAKTEGFCILGNHEIGNAPSTKYGYEVYSEIMCGNPRFWARDLGEIKIIGLHNANWGIKFIEEEQITFLREQFADGKPTLLLMHAPLKLPTLVQPVVDFWGEEMREYFLLDKPENPNDPIRKFWDIIEDPECPVMGIFTGHIHLTHEDEFAPGKKQYTICPTFRGGIRKIIVSGE